MRLQKYIAHCGVMSRRAAEAAILEGRVCLNGKKVTEMGVIVTPEKDLVTVDGQELKPILEKQTFLFYKPRGVVTTKSDEKGRKCIMDFFQDLPSLNPVGRLDADSEGLILLTHDGDLALKLTHPRYEVEKIYCVKIEPLRQFLPSSKKETHSAFQDQLVHLGVELEDGLGKFKKLEETGVNEWRVTVNEGRNRFVRRMFEAVGFRVVELKRIQMGEFQLGSLKPGERKEVK